MAALFYEPLITTADYAKISVHRDILFYERLLIIKCVGCNLILCDIICMRVLLFFFLTVK